MGERYGVQFQFGCSVTGYEQPIVRAGGEEWRAGRLYVCSGDDLQSLYLQAVAGAGLIRCKLQMMRTPPVAGWRLGPMLAAGLTLRHYTAFRDCPSLPMLRRRVEAELPEYDRYGIHVMVSQNGRGELVIGDSHEYEGTIEPFDKPEIDDLILRYLDRFLAVPALRIAARWHGATAACDEVPRGRPHPDMIHRLMTELGVEGPAGVAKVGDTPADLLEGQAAGCGLVIGVTEGSHTRAELAVHPHTHLIGTVAELPSLLGLP